MVRVYRFRLYPNRVQEAKLHETLYLLRQLYNGVLQERMDSYKKQHVSLSAYVQMAEIKEVRAVCPEYRAIHVHLLQDVITRVDLAYRAFFRRLKSGEKPGFPRFKGRGRYHSFGFKDAGRRNGAYLDAAGSRVKLAGIGHVKVKLHRVVEGTVKQIGVTLSGEGHWYVNVTCVDVPAEPLPATGKSIGVDVGISTFAALSDGTLVANPRPFERAQKALARTQRSVSRRKRGSHRRRKAVAVLRGQHDKVRRVRLDFHHKVARRLVRDFDRIAVEDLNVKGLAKGFLAKQVADAAWGSFLLVLASKAESAGRELERVDPRGTSQWCSGCGCEVRKDLSVRVHSCPHCGLVLDRDVNAARNIGNRLGHSRRGGMSSGSPVEPRSPYLAVLGR